MIKGRVLKFYTSFLKDKCSNSNQPINSVLNELPLEKCHRQIFCAKGHNRAFKFPHKSWPKIGAPETLKRGRCTCTCMKDKSFLKDFFELHTSLFCNITIKPETTLQLYHED